VGWGGGVAAILDWHYRTVVERVRRERGASVSNVVAGGDIVVTSTPECDHCRWVRDHT